MIQCIEKLVGKIKICRENLFLNNITDMDELEYWEERLDKLNEEYAITFNLKRGKYSYNLYCNTKRKNGAFK